jgi:hypothetical protein
VTPDLEMQLDVLVEVLREDPDVLTLQALADRVLANPAVSPAASRLPAPFASWTTRAWSLATAAARDVSTRGRLAMPAA